MFLLLHAQLPEQTCYTYSENLPPIPPLRIAPRNNLNIQSLLGHCQNSGGKKLKQTEDCILSGRTFCRSSRERERERPFEGPHSAASARKTLLQLLASVVFCHLFFFFSRNISILMSVIHLFLTRVGIIPGKWCLFSLQRNYSEFSLLWQKKDDMILIKEKRSG